VKDELQASQSGALLDRNRTRKGSIQDLQASIHATGICLREEYQSSFNLHKSVLAMDDEDEEIGYGVGNTESDNNGEDTERDKIFGAFDRIKEEEGEDSSGIPALAKKPKIAKKHRAWIGFDQRVCQILDIARTLIAMWSIVWTPLYWAFRDVIDFSPFWIGCDTIFSIIYLCGLILDFVTSKPNFKGAKEIIWIHEIRDFIFHSPLFYLDVITVIPFIIIIPDSPFRLLVLLRFHRLVKTPGSWVESLHCNSHSGASDFVSIGRVIIWFFLLSHVLGSIWFHIQDEASRLRHVSDVEEWNRTTTTFYIQAFRDGAYMLMTRDRPAYTDKELVMVGLMGPSGSFFIIWMTGHFAVLLQRLQALTMENCKQLALIRAAMSRQRLPKDLQFRVLQFHYYSLLQHDQMAYEVLFRSLSTPLTCEIKFWIFRKLIRYVPFFQDASPKAIKGIVLALTLVNFSPGDVIIRCGDECKQMYFVLKGMAQVLDAKDLTPLKKLKPGDYFGELGLISKSPRRRTAWVRANTYCCLAELTSDLFEEILADFPEQRILMLEHMKAAFESDRKVLGESVSRRSSAASSVADGPSHQKDCPNSPAKKIDFILDNIRSMENRLAARMTSVEIMVRNETRTAQMTPFDQSRRMTRDSVADFSQVATPKRRYSSSAPGQTVGKKEAAQIVKSITGRESFRIPNSIRPKGIDSKRSSNCSFRVSQGACFTPRQLQDVLSSYVGGSGSNKVTHASKAALASDSPNSGCSENYSPDSDEESELWCPSQGGDSQRSGFGSWCPSHAGDSLGSMSSITSSTGTSSGAMLRYSYVHGLGGGTGGGFPIPPMRETTLESIQDEENEKLSMMSDSDDD